MARDKSIDKPLKPRPHRRQERRRNGDRGRRDVGRPNEEPILRLCLIILVLFLLALVVICFVHYFLGPDFHF